MRPGDVDDRGRGSGWICGYCADAHGTWVLWRGQVGAGAQVVEMGVCSRGCGRGADSGSKVGFFHVLGSEERGWVVGVGMREGWRGVEVLLSARDDVIHLQV